MFRKYSNHIVVDGQGIIQTELQKLQQSEGELLRQ